MKCKFKGCDKDVRDNPYRGHTPLFCSKKCKNKDAVNTYRLKMKQRVVDYKGGKCQICGYNKTIAGLHFHHVDESQKNFEVSRAMTLHLDKVKDEVDKCILVCANCHAEIHQGMVPMAVILPILNGVT